MPEVKNKCIIINYKSMAQYVHGTSVQQCLLDQLSGASVAQFTDTSNMSCITYESIENPNILKLNLSILAFHFH